MRINRQRRWRPVLRSGASLSCCWRFSSAPRSPLCAPSRASSSTVRSSTTARRANSRGWRTVRGSRRTAAVCSRRSRRRSGAWSHYRAPRGRVSATSTIWCVTSARPIRTSSTRASGWPCANSSATRGTTPAGWPCSRAPSYATCIRTGASSVGVVASKWRGRMDASTSTSRWTPAAGTGRRDHDWPS